MPSVTVDMSGIRRLRDRVDEVGERARNLAPVLKGSAQALDTLIQRGFSSSSGPNGERWPALKPSTVRRKGSAKPLIDRGLMRQQTFAKAKGDRVAFGVGGSRARIAPYHQFGTSTIPARPFLPMDRAGKPTFRSGKARTWYTRQMRRVARYVMTGKL